LSRDGVVDARKCVYALFEHMSTANHICTYTSTERLIMSLLLIELKHVRVLDYEDDRRGEESTGRREKGDTKSAKSECETTKPGGRYTD